MEIVPYNITESSSSFPSTMAQRMKKYNLRDSYQVDAFVYACVNCIADSIAGVPLVFSRGNSGTPIPASSPLMSLFLPPKQWETGTTSELVKKVFIYLGVFGEVFIVLEKKNGIPSDIRVEPPFAFDAVVNGDGTEILGWKENSPSKINKFLPGDLIQLKYINPYSKWRGLSPLNSARLAIEQDLNMSIWNSGFFHGGVKNPIAIFIKQSLTKKQRDEFLKQIRESYSGFKAGHAPLIVEGGADAKPLIATLKDLDFIEGKQLTREEICAVYHVPPAIVGIFRYANYANSKEQMRMFWLNCLVPKMNYFKEVIQLGLLNPHFPGIQVDWLWDSIDALKQDPKDLATTLKLESETILNYLGLGFKMKDIAVLMDRPALSLIKDPKKPKPLSPITPPKEDAEEGAEDSAEPSSPPKEEEEEKKKPKKGIFSVEESFLSASYSKKELDSYSINHFKYVLEEIRNLWVIALNNFSEGVTENVLRKLEIKADPFLNPLVWKGRWVETVNSLVEWTYGLGVTNILALIGENKKRLPLEVEINNEGWREELLTLSKEGIYSNSVKSASVGMGIVEGLNNKVSLLMNSSPFYSEKVIEGVKEYRAKLKTSTLSLASTIGGSIYNEARWNSMGILGVKRHIWVSSPDSSTRTLHKRENGNWCEYGDRFPVTRLRYPHDPSGGGISENIINCRCVTIPTVVERDHQVSLI